MRSFFAGSAALLWAAGPALAQGEPPKPAQIVINDSGGAMQGAMKKAQAMADWLIEAAQYGTKYIQNATDHDISDARDVPRLCERHTRWLFYPTGCRLGADPVFSND